MTNSKELAQISTTYYLRRQFLNNFRARPHNALPLSTARFSSKEEFPGNLRQTEEINGLLKEIDTEQDEEIPYKPGNEHYGNAPEQANERYKSNRFDESGRLVLDTSFDRLMKSKEGLGQTGNKFNQRKPEFHFKVHFTLH